VTQLTTYSDRWVPPLYSTVRNPSLPTYGPAVTQVAAALGRRQMPWQQHVSAVANEVVTHDDGTWAFRYPTVVMSTPRQAGKTTLLEDVLGHRCMTMPDYRCWYTAQTQLAAVDVFNEWVTGLESRMPGRWRFRHSAGQNRAMWPATKSFIRVFAPTPESLHSKQSDFVGLDEVWKWSLQEGGDLTQAVVPTQATRPRRQLWIVSTAGNENSQWLRSWVEKGRASLDDPASRIAYFEWSTPEDYELTDPVAWAQEFHPAYGFTQDAEGIRDAFAQMGEAEFRRAYMNRWPEHSSSWRASWGTAPGTPLPPDAPVVLAVDAPPHHRSAAIVAAGKIDDDLTGVEVVDYRPGVGWLADRLVQLHRKYRAPVVIARTGPLGFLVEELQRAGVNVVAATAGDYADAVSRFQTLVVAHRVAHTSDDLLNVAVHGVQETNTERPTWRRRDTNTDISPLVAASLAVWKASTPPVKPKVRAG
jgi:phage terminase large subunit-like protein